VKFHVFRGYTFVFVCGFLIITPPAEHGYSQVAQIEPPLFPNPFNLCDLWIDKLRGNPAFGIVPTWSISGGVQHEGKRDSR
jgi:hypothetical protein